MNFATLFNGRTITEIVNNNKLTLVSTIVDNVKLCIFTNENLLTKEKVVKEFKNPNNAISEFEKMFEIYNMCSSEYE